MWRCKARMTQHTRNDKGESMLSTNNIKGNLWYGASRYPVDSVDKKLYFGSIMAKHDFEGMVRELIEAMGKYAGGFPLRAELVSFSLVGDGFDFELEAGDVNWYVTDAARGEVALLNPNAELDK